MLKISMFEMDLKITDLRLQLQLPGANELKCSAFNVVKYHNFVPYSPSDTDTSHKW